MSSFSELIATPSVSCVDPRFDQSNQEVINLLSNWLESLGAKVECMPIANAPGKSNLIACFGEGEGGLVLSGHTDTVPYNEHLWQQDPFKLTEKDGKLYGLGATDMKVFFPLVMDILSTLELGKLQQPIFVLATADEESTMSGAVSLAASGKTLGRYALIGEPTGLQPIHSHKGVMMESIRLIGQAGHSSNPGLGHNAVDGMLKVLTELSRLREHFKEQYSNAGFSIPYPTMNFGSLHGGDNPNRICAECELKLDVRLLPGMEIEEIRKQIRESAANAIAGTGLQLKCDAMFDGVPAMHTDDHSTMVKLAESLSNRESSSVAFATEGPYLNQMGMETIIMGPGDIDVAHQANEYVPLERIQPMSNILQSMIQTICMK